MNTARHELINDPDNEDGKRLRASYKFWHRSSETEAATVKLNSATVLD